MGHNELWPVENRLRAMLYYSRRELPYSSCQPVLSWLVCDGVLVACVQAWSEVVLAGPLFRTVGEDLRNDLEDVLFKGCFCNVCSGRFVAIPIVLSCRRCEM